MKNFIFILLLVMAVSTVACQGSRLIAPAKEVVPVPAPDNCPDNT